MRTAPIAVRYALLTTLSVVLATLLSASRAYPEAYIGGQFGMALPSIGRGLTDIDINSSFFVQGTTHSDLALSTSFMWGVKGGYYFKSARWFGLEAEYFSTSPHIKQQVHTFTNSSGTASSTSPLQGAHFLVQTVAPLNLMFRYPKTRLQPYFGIGPGIFFAKIKGEGLTPDSTASTSDNGRIGVNAKLGFEYFITRHVTAFGEWKYNYARFQFKENTDLWPFPYGFNGTYRMHLVAFGLSYHF